ncbi:MAG: PAS domain S-box protein, partial [Candidatus Methylomirabilota bacterium]
MRVVTPRRKAAVILLLILIPLGILGMALHETFERQRDAAERHRRVLEIVSLVGTMENRLADMQVDLDGIVLFTDDTAVRQLERNYVAFLVGIGSLRQLVDGGLAASLTEIEAGVRAWRQRVAPETLRASGEASRGESVWLFRSLRTRIGDLRRRLFELLRTQERFLSGQAATQDDLFRRVVVEGALAVLGMGTLGGLLLLRERGRANHRLAADQERYRTLFEEAPIAYHEIDSAGVIRRVNRAECALLGFARDELLGRPVWELVAPAARESARMAVIRKLAGEAPLVPFQREYQRKDGGLVTVEIHENLIREAGGPGEGIRSALLDVTERKRAEELLRLRGAALGAAANAIVLTDRTGRIAWINPAFTALTGYTEPEAMGQNYAFLKSGQHDDVFHRRIWETVLAGEVWRGEVVNRRKDGALYPEEMTITPLRDAEGEISHFVAIKQDISERRSIERMKDEFVSVVSHELRTPLTSIRGSLGLLAGGVLGPLSEPGQRMVEIAVSNTDRLVRLINDILDIERMTSGKIVMRKAACDLG